MWHHIHSFSYSFEKSKKYLSVGGWRSIYATDLQWLIIGKSDKVVSSVGGVGAKSRKFFHHQLYNKDFPILSSHKEYHKITIWMSHWRQKMVDAHWKTSPYCWQTSNYKNLAISFQLNAYKGFNWTHFRISLHIFDNVHTSLWETDHTIGWILFEVT